MTRLTHIILLLLCLAVIASIGLSGPGSFGDGVNVPGQKNEQSEVPGKMIFNPEAPDSIPDLKEGYVFLEDRVLLESDFASFNKGGEKTTLPSVSEVDLDEVFYSGSIITGELRKALVTYPSVQRNVKRGAKGRTKGRAKGRASAMKHEQIDQGGQFMGFLVASVEEDKIVFERDGERVEKFLHDQNKDRISIKRKARKPPAKKPAGGKPTTVLPRKTAPKQPAVENARARREPPKDLPQRRSQRLLRRDPSFMIQNTLGAPRPAVTPPTGTSSSR